MFAGLLFSLLSSLLVLALFASACGEDDDGPEPRRGKLDTIAAGKLKVGSAIPYRPFEFGRAPDYDGFDVDLVNEIAKRIDLEAQFVDSPFNPIFRKLDQGRFDMVASAAAITPERERTVDFSKPYFSADQSVIVQQPSDIRSVADLDGKRVGAQTGSTGSEYARDHTDATIRNFDAISDAFNALEAGQVDAVISDFPTSKEAADQKGNLKIVETIPTGEAYGLAFRKNSDTLRETVNDTLEEMKDDGAYEKIYRKWFETTPPESILRTKS